MGKIHVVTHTLKKLNQVRALVSEEGKDRAFSTDEEQQSSVLSDVLLKRVSTVHSVIKCLAIICCSDGTSYSLKSMICSISDHSVLFLDWTRLYLADVFHKLLSTKDPNWSLWKGSQAKIQQQDDTKTTCKVTSWICTTPTKPVCTSLSETPNVGAQLHEKEAFYLKAKYLYPPETLTIQEIIKHIRQRKLKFPSVFILVNILSVLSCLSLIFLFWK